MEFKILSEFKCLGSDSYTPEYKLYSFNVKAEINGKVYNAGTKEWWADAETDINDIMEGCPHYVFITDYGYDDYAITTFFDTHDSDDEDFIEEGLETFYKGYVEKEHAYIVEIDTNEIIAEYHDSKNSRSIIIRNKEKCNID